MPRANSPTRKTPGSKLREPTRRWLNGGADDQFDPEEVSQLRTEVERLRNELFLARKESALAWRQGRTESYQRVVRETVNEIRTPLTVVLGWTELLLSGKLPTSQLPHAYELIDAAGWQIEAILRWLERLAERELHPVACYPGCQEAKAPCPPAVGSPPEALPTD